MNGTVSFLENDQNKELNYACMPYNKKKKVDLKNYTLGRPIHKRNV